MGNGIIDVRSYELESTSNFLNKSSSNISSCGDKTSSLFSSFTSVGLFSEGSAKIKKQMGKISSGVGKMGKSIDTFRNNIESKELSLKTKADAIEIPNDFVTNDSSSVVTMESGMLSKNDGNAINSGNDNDEKDFEFNNSKEFNKMLKNIVKDYEEINGEIAINGNSASLESIVKDANDSAIDGTIDESILYKKTLSSITKEMNEKMPELNMALEIGSVKLLNLNTESVKNVSFEDSYKISRRMIAESLNNGNYTLKSFKK